MANEALYLDMPAAQAKMQEIKAAAETLRQGAQSFSKSVNLLTTEAWRGNASTDVRNRYESEYKNLIEVRIPQALETFEQFMNQCAQGIKDTDAAIAK